MIFYEQKPSSLGAQGAIATAIAYYCGAVSEQRARAAL
jgi:hypothetical protein